MTSLSPAQLAPLRETLRAHPYGYTLPAEYYYDPLIYQADLQLVYYRSWLLVGFAAQIKKPGEYFTVKVGDHSVVIVRDNDKQIRAFHNVCRHRGSKLCIKEQGKAPNLVCPYHQWTYKLDGTLIYAREMQGDFDMSAHGLMPVHIRNASGYLFICLAEDAPSFEAFAEAAAPYLSYHNIENAKVAAQTHLVEKGNWKLTWENNRECYHCPGGHAELSRSFDDDPNAPGISGLNQNDVPLEGVAADWERQGVPARYRGADTGQWRFVRMPLKPGFWSETMSGKPASRIPMVPFKESVGTGLLFHYPTTWNHFMYDHTVSFRVLPLSPEETLVTSTWLVHEDAVEGEDYDLKTLMEVWEATNEQDKTFVELTQEGVRNPAYRPGPYNTPHEDGVIGFVEWYRGAFTGAHDTSKDRLRVVA